jgi:hypothetical protein
MAETKVIRKRITPEDIEMKCHMEEMKRQMEEMKRQMEEKDAKIEQLTTQKTKKGLPPPRSVYFTKAVLLEMDKKHKSPLTQSLLYSLHPINELTMEQMRDEVEAWRHHTEMHIEKHRMRAEKHIAKNRAKEQEMLEQMFGGSDETEEQDDE